MADVHAVAVVAAQEGVPGHDGFLGDPRPATQPQLGGDFAFVRDRTFGQPGVFAVLGQKHVEAFGVFDGPPHDLGVVDAFAVVGEEPHFRIGVHHHAEFGEFFARQAFGDGSHRVHVAQADGLALVPHGFGDDRLVHDRVGVCHGEHRCEPAFRGGGRTGGDGFGVFPAGFPQVHVDVHQAGQEHIIFPVDHPVSRGGGGADLGDDPVGNKHAYGFAFPVGANVGDEEGAGFGVGKFPGCWIVHGCTHYGKFSPRSRGCRCWR